MASVAPAEHATSKGKTFKINHGGDIESFPYISGETVEKVIVLAIHEFHLSAQPHQLGLFKDGQPNPLDPGSTLEQAGVHPGEELILKPIVVEGGE